MWFVVESLGFDFHHWGLLRHRCFCAHQKVVLNHSLAISIHDKLVDLGSLNRQMLTFQTVAIAPSMAPSVWIQQEARVSSWHFGEGLVLPLAYQVFYVVDHRNYSLQNYSLNLVDLDFFPHSSRIDEVDGVDALSELKLQ